MDRPSGELVVEKTEAAWILVLRGEHDLSTADPITAELGAVFAHGTKVVLDLRETTFIESGEVEAASKMAHAHGWALVGLGVGVSLDELAIGFSAGLLRISIVLAVALVAVQAFLVAQLGVRVGARVGEEIREGAERLAGVALIILGVVILATRAL